MSNTRNVKVIAYSRMKVKGVPSKLK